MGIEILEQEEGNGDAPCSGDISRSLEIDFREAHDTTWRQELNLGYDRGSFKKICWVSETSGECGRPLMSGAQGL